MRYHFKVHKEKDGYWAESVEKGLNVRSQADTLTVLLENLKEALNQAIDEPEGSDWVPPVPDMSIKGRGIYEVSVDPQIAMASQVRSKRLAQGWSQRKAATMLGIKHTSQYQKLESAAANMEFGTMIKLRKVYPDFSIDQVLA